MGRHAKMKKIKLTQGKFTLVDDEDYEELNKHKWYALYYKSTNSYYAVRNSKKVNGKQKKISMTREIMGAKKGQIVDHINHDTLENRKHDLRICTNQQNNMNSLPQKNSSSKYKGVCWHTKGKKWMSYINIDGKQIHIGLFDDEVSAGHAYDEKAIEVFDEFAYVNFGGEKV